MFYPDGRTTPTSPLYPHHTDPRAEAAGKLGLPDEKQQVERIIIRNRPEEPPLGSHFVLRSVTCDPERKFMAMLDFQGDNRSQVRTMRP